MCRLLPSIWLPQRFLYTESLVFYTPISREGARFPKSDGGRTDGLRRLDDGGHHIERILDWQTQARPADYCAVNDTNTDHALARAQLMCTALTQQMSLFG